MTRLAVGALAVLLVVAGCGGDPKADPTPTKSTSPSASTAPSPTPPALPDAAKADTKAGAIAFVKYYIELINHAQSTGDVRPLAQVEDPGCDSCANGRHALATIYDAGGSIEGGQLSIRVIMASRSPRYEGWVVSGSLAFAPETVRRAAGADPENLTGGKALVNAFVTKKNAAHEWRVMEWTRGS